MSWSTPSRPREPVRRLVLALALLGALACRPETPPSFRARVGAALGDRQPAGLRLPLSAPHPPQLDRLTILGAELHATLERHPSLDAVHAAAVLDLALTPAQAGVVDRAASRLGEVVARRPDDVAALVDLAAARALQGTLHRSARYRFEALEAVERAAALDSANPVVLYDRALLLDRAGLNGLAASTWRRYLDARPAPAGAATARDRLAALVEPGRGVSVRERVVDSLLPAWAEAVRRGREDRADRLFLEADSLAEEASLRGDSTGYHAVAAVAGAGDRTRVAEGLAAYADGWARYHAGRFEQAVGPLARADRLLAPTPELAVWPRLLLAAVALYRRRYPEALDTYTAIAEAAAVRSDRSLRARAAVGAALVEARTGRMDRSADWYAVAATALVGLDEPASLGSVQSQQAEIDWYRGLDDRALAAAERAIVRLGAGPAGDLRENALASLGSMLADLRMPRAALAVLAEGTWVADQTGRAKDPPEMAARTAEAAEALGLRELARARIAAGRGMVAGLSDSLMRSRIAADLDRAEAGLLAEDDPAGAAARLDRVVRYFEAGYEVALPPVLVRRAAARLAAGDSAGARADLDRAARLVEARAADTGDRADQAAQLEARADLFHALVALEVDRGDTLAAFREVDRSHPDVGRPGSRDPSPLSLPSRLAPDLAVVEYAVLEDRTVAWVVRRSGIRMVVTPVDRAAERALVDRVENLARHPGDDLADDPAAALVDLLITPIEPALAGVRELVIVPDGLLRRVPFAALRRRSTGRFLVEDLVLRFASRAADVGNSRPASWASLRRRPVLVAGPRFDREVFPDLDPLEHVVEEVGGIASIYPAARTLAPRQATRAGVLAALLHASVFHFAGHVRSLDVSTDATHLVLAEAAGGLRANALFGREIARLDLRGLDLVVLSGCGTVARDRSVGGLSSVAQAFLAAGAGGVVSSLWEVDDRETAELMIDFHRALAGGAPPPLALQRAQRLAIRRSDGRVAAAWAAFRFEGR